MNYFIALTAINYEATNAKVSRFAISVEVIICDALRDLVPSVQFKEREKHPWRSVTLLRVTLRYGRFSRFLNCTNGMNVPLS